MYKVNTKTKIGRKIKEIIENGLYRDALEKSDISFLTGPDEAHSDMNVHIYPEDRLEHLKTKNEDYNGWFGNKDIHIPGCIINCLTNKYIDMAIYAENVFEVKGKTTIKVEFGNNAASSRTQEKQTEIIEYPINSHNQLEELKYLFENDEITLIHSYNPNKEETTIQVQDYGFETDTVLNTAQVAVDTAVTLIYEEGN